MPISCWIRFSSSCICLRSFRSSAPSGSSSSRTRGWFTSARAERDPLLLAARELPRLPLREACEADELEHLGDASLELALRDALPLEPEADVVLDRHVREERIALEDGVDVALVRRETRPRPGRRGRCGPRSAPRNRRSSAASSSSRSRTARASRRTTPRGISTEIPSTATASSNRLTTPSRRTSAVAAAVAVTGRAYSGGSGAAKRSLDALSGVRRHHEHRSLGELHDDVLDAGVLLHRVDATCPCRSPTP